MSETDMRDALIAVSNLAAQIPGVPDYRLPRKAMGEDCGDHGPAASDPIATAREALADAVLAWTVDRVPWDEAEKRLLNAFVRAFPDALATPEKTDA